MIPKKYRLPAKDFKTVYSKGIKYRGRYGMLVVSQSSINTPQFGFVLNKKIGNAVQRHRMTRILRVCITEIIKELCIQNTPIKAEYVAFEYCDNKDMVKEDLQKIFSQILKK